MNASWCSSTICWHQVWIHCWRTRYFSVFVYRQRIPVLSSHHLCYLGDIPDLFSDEEVDMIVTSIRMELRGLGLIDSRDNCWSFFIERIRRQLKVWKNIFKFPCLTSSTIKYIYHHSSCPPGRLVFLPSRVHVADTCTEVSSSGELYSNRLVPLLASARPAVCQHHFHRKDTWTGGDSTIISDLYSIYLTY